MVLLVRSAIITRAEFLSGGRSPRIPATVLEYFKIAEMTWIQYILVDFSHAVVDRANDLHEGQGITR
jgi:hypothetical protein